MSSENPSSSRDLVTEGWTNSDSDGADLCQPCKLVGLNIVAGPSRDIPLGDICRIIKTFNCTLCSLVTKALSPVFAQQLLNYANKDNRILEVALLPVEYYAEYKLELSIRGLDGNSPDWIYEQCRAKNCRLRVWQRDLEDCKMITPTTAKPIQVARKLRNYFCDFDVMGYHLQQCRMKHYACDRPRHTLSMKASSILGPHQISTNLRLVDTEELQIIPPPGACRYVALSYVWEPVDQGHCVRLTRASFQDFTKPGGLPILDLPQTIADAIEVCRRLNERYLWVDALCIIQDDEQDKQTQLPEMANIFGLATFTIVAACDKEPQTGLSCLRYRSPPQASGRVHGITLITGDIPLNERIREALWNTRGWTYQECLLSRRLLIFTVSQVFFVCAEGTRAEDTTYLESTNLSIRDETNRLGLWSLPNINRDKSCWDEYCDTIHRFRERKLTFQSDTLFAISGILKAIGQHCNDRFICGLPEKIFRYALLWQPRGSSERYEGLPSWSWSGWAGGICHPARSAVRLVLGPEKRKSNNRFEVAFKSSLTDLKVQDSNGAEILLDSTNSDDAVRSWLNIKECREDSKVKSTFGGPEIDPVVVSPKPTELPTEKSSLEPRYLHFRSRATRLTIAPDAETHETSSDLRRYRILKGNAWVGTIFLTPECVKTYPTVTHGCEFVELSCFSAYPHNFRVLFRDLPISQTGPICFDPEFLVQAELEVDAEFAQRTGARPQKRRHISHDSYGTVWVIENEDSVRWISPPPPPKMDLSHVMWIERIGNFCYRIAVGVVYRKILDGMWYPEETFWLG